MKRIPVILAICFLILNFFDGFLTMKLVEEYGIQVEMNPLMKWAIESMGDWFLLPKIALGIIISFIIVVTWSKRRLARFAMISIISFYAVIVGIHILGLLGV